MDDPADDAREQVVADFAAVAEVDFLEVFGAVGHFEHGLCSDVPDGLHFPSRDVGAAGGCQDGEPFVRDVEAVGDVDGEGTGTDKRADGVGQSSIGDFAVVGGEIEVFQEAWRFAEESGPVGGDEAKTH